MDTSQPPIVSIKRRRSRKKKSGPKPRPVIEFPQPISEIWDDPPSFADALSLHMLRHRDTNLYLCTCINRPGEKLNPYTIRSWKVGKKAPRSISSLIALERIERRYSLPKGYFRLKLPHLARSSVGHKLSNISESERRRLAWHLPDDFDFRSQSEQEKILRWVRETVVSGGTEYRRFQAKAIRHKYAVYFPGQEFAKSSYTKLVEAPPLLAAEMKMLLAFKTSILTAQGLKRSGTWGEATASQKVEHFGLMFGAMVASPKSVNRGLGVPPNRLTFGLLLFPQVWDWYLNWRMKRRGFYTAWEMDMLRIGLAFTRSETGWIRQHQEMRNNLMPIPELVSQKEIQSVRRNWHNACDVIHAHAKNRIKELERVARVHRDPFEPILPVLEADSPLGQYRKIADEIVKLMPDRRRYPTSAAEAVRSYLMLRIGMHLGVRQKNLRQLLVALPHCPPRTDRQLNDLKRGELRWVEREMKWEVYIPSIAFKNAHSSYFNDRPYRLTLPNLEGLYGAIEDYLQNFRSVLLNQARDPGTFFVKTVKKSSSNAEYDQNTFYEAWRLTIQRYGVYNPYTERGAIKGLLPHGPHSVRDVLATHILKETGSYEQASYAIQDTAETVANHYGRFLPQDKAAMAAKILNKIWGASG